jgi:hypothetical protein
MDALRRKGLIVELEEKLDELSRRLRGISGSISDVLFSIDGQHLDTDGKSVKQFAAEYFDVQNQAQKIRKRIEELRSE